MTMTDEKTRELQYQFRVRMMLSTGEQNSD